MATRHRRKVRLLFAELTPSGTYNVFFIQNNTTDVTLARLIASAQRTTRALDGILRGTSVFYGLTITTWDELVKETRARYSERDYIIKAAFLKTQDYGWLFTKNYYYKTQFQALADVKV